MEIYNINDLFYDKTLVKKITLDAGIYLITNNLNGKVYVGQAIRLRKRLMSHIYNYTNNKYDTPLYRAFNKYGLNNFTYKIVKTLEGTDYKVIRKQLDALEVDYIKQYNSYHNGYNQTIGEDGGILGYKFTEAQIKKQSINTNKRIDESLEYKIYLYDITNKYTYMFIAPKYSDRYFNWKEGTTKSMVHYTLGKNKYIVYRTEEQKQSKLEKLNTSNKSTKFENKYTKEEYISIKNSLGNYTASSLAIALKVSKCTVYNYDKEFKINEFIKPPLVKYKIVDIFSNKEYIVTCSEGAALLNTSEKNFRSTAARKIADRTLYKKKYKILKYEQID